jgi:hypothetical protein
MIFQLQLQLTFFYTHPLLHNSSLPFRLSSFCALQTRCTENLKEIFPEMKLRGLVPNSSIHVSVSDLCNVFPRAVCQFCCSRIGGPIERIYKSLTDTCM